MNNSFVCLNKCTKSKVMLSNLMFGDSFMLKMDANAGTNIIYRVASNTFMKDTVHVLLILPDGVYHTDLPATTEVVKVDVIKFNINLTFKFSESK